jgi:hypothetical protein
MKAGTKMRSDRSSGFAGPASLEGASDSTVNSAII